jgi:hypothetical protein
MTVYDPTNRMVNEGPVSSLSYQIDKGDGAYALYKNGSLVAYQNDMVLPGKYDFSSSNTTISLMESYSKLIWRGHVNGNCETWSAPPPAYAGTCASSIGNGGCGFERMDFRLERIRVYAALRRLDSVHGSYRLRSVTDAESPGVRALH